MVTAKTYDCDICRGVNTSERLHCQYCGTIPAQYSILRKPAVHKTNDDWQRLTFGYIEVLVAFGAIRQTSTRTVKLNPRTVKADYYATE